MIPHRVPGWSTPDWFDPAVFDSATTHTLTSVGARIRYRTGGSGDGPRLVFVHGGRAHSTWWAHQIALFGQEPPKWAALDLSGHGDSGWRDEYRAQVWLDELDAVARALSVDDDLILVGHSLGGMLSILLAARGTVPLDRVVAVDAVPLDPGMAQGRPEPSLSKASYPSLGEGAAAFSSRSARAGWPGWLARFVGERSLRRDGDAWVWRHDNASRVIEPPVIDDFGALDLSRVTLVTGETSPYGPSIDASSFVRRSGVELRRVRIDAGHDVMMEQPLEFHRALVHELER